MFINKITHFLVVVAVLLFCTTSSAEMKEERIISAGNAVTELIYALGAQEQLIAVDVTSHLPSHLALPKVGYHRQLSAEGLISMNPTRVVGSDEMGPTSTLNLLKQSGIKIDIVNTEASIDGLLKRVEQLAKITKKEHEHYRFKIKY